MRQSWLTLGSTVILAILTLTGYWSKPVLVSLLPLPMTGSVPAEVVMSPVSVQASAPTPTPTLSLTPTLTLPVLMGTPVPLPQEPITPDNVDQIRELAMWGKGQVKQIIYSADGKFLVVGSTTGLWLYDAKTLELQRFRQTNTEIMNLIFLPDNETIMAQVGSNTIIRWDTNSGTVLSSRQVGIKELVRPVFSPDGTRLASILEDGQIGLWEIETGRLLKTFGIEADVKPKVGLLAISPDSKLLASETLSHSATINIRLWDVETGNLLRTLSESSEFGGPLSSLAFSPDGAQLASGVNSIHLWEVKTGKLLQTLSNGGGGLLTFSPDGTKLATAGYEALYLWDIGSGKIEPYTLATRWISALAFSPTGDKLISGGGDDPPQLWSVSTSKLLGVLDGFGDGIWDMAVSPDGSIFTTHRKGNFIGNKGETANGVRVWDVGTGRVTRTIGPFIPAYRLALSANGRILALIEHEGIFNTGENPVRFWNATNGGLLQTITSYSLDFDLALSPDGQSAFISHQVHDTQTGEIRYELDLSGSNFNSIWNVVFSPDGTKLAAGQLESNRGFLWEAKTGKQLHQLIDEGSYFKNGVTFSPDGKVLAIGNGFDNVIQLWQVETGAKLRTLTTDSNDIWGLAFSPNGAILASSARYNSLVTQLWNSQTGELLRNVDSSQIGEIHFTADGKLMILLRLQDGVVQFWGIPPAY